MNDYPRSYLIPGGTGTDRLEERLREGLGLKTVARGERRRDWMESFDWRLWSAGCELYLEQEAGQSALHRRDLETGASKGQLTVTEAPRFVWDLPRGPFRERLEPVLEMRALLPLVTVRSRFRNLTLRDGDGKLTLQVEIEETRVAGPADTRSRPLDRRLTINPVKGYETPTKNLTLLIDRETELVTAEPLLLKALAATGREPGDYSSKLQMGLEPQMRADEAAKRILAELLEAMLRNEPGIIEDTDTEFLHDFRVAVRRTRTALSQIKGVFAQRILDRFGPQFAWLGRLTTPTRDLDVYLLQLDEYRHALPETIRGDLDPLQEFLQRHRAEELATLTKGLQSARYRRLIEDWERFLASAGPRHSSLPNATRPLQEVAGHRIWKMYKRVIREGEAITPGSPDEDLHEMRKSGKKLRYLMEFFQSLYPPDQVKRSIKALKNLQDNLGEFQDLSVQMLTLRRFAEQMVSEREVPSETLIAMGILVDQLGERQNRAREEFTARFEQFTTPENRDHFRALFKPVRSGERLAS
jgi:CHAD domain-containing protein